MSVPDPGPDTRPGASPPRPGSGSSEARATFALPHYGALWTSNLVQFVCFHVLFLAMQWLVTSLTDLRVAVGGLAFVQGGTIALASPLAGVIVDRRPKRDLIVAGRFGMAMISFGMGMLVWTEWVLYWHLLATAVVGGVLGAALGPATQTYVVDVVGRQRTDHAISLNAIGTSVGTIGGAALAGVLIHQLGVVPTYLSAAAGVALSAVLVWRIPIPGRVDRSEHTSPARDLVEGFRFVVERPPLLLALIACAMALFNGALNPMRVIYARHVFEAGASGLGMMSAAHGIGTLVAALFLTLRPPTGHFGRLITGTMLVYATGLVCYAVASSFEAILVIELLIGIAGQTWNICAMIGFQLAVPQAMRGRVLSMVFTLAQLGFVGGFFVGVLADQAGDRVAVGVFGAIPTIVLTGLLVFGWRTLGRMERWVGE